MPSLSHVTVSAPPPGPPSGTSTIVARTPKETPVKSSITSQSKFRDAVPQEQRRVLREELNNMIPEVGLDWFFDHVLPPLPDGMHLGRVIESLENSAILDGRWSDFEDDPVDTSSENLVFKNLEPVFEAVVKAAQTTFDDRNLERPKQQHTILIRPNAPPVSHRPIDTKPDFCFLSIEDAEILKKNVKKSPEWYSLTGLGEAKRAKDSDNMNKEDTRQRNDNVQKTLLNLYYVILAAALPLWFGSRATIFVTKPFNFITDHESLARVFLSFAFASHQDLGWDPTIKFAGLDNHERTYDIAVGDKTYTTVRMLSDMSADNLVSRAARVWLVKGQGGEQYVLKDVWLDHDRDPEDITQHNLLEAVADKFGSKEVGFLQEHLLTHKAFGKLRVDGVAGLVEDDTTLVMLRNASSPICSSYPLEVETPVNPQSQSLGPSSATDPLAHPPAAAPPAEKLLRRKYHYRIVFEEYATTIYDETRLDNVITAVKDVVKALKIIHESGWVHRDISGGNVYCFKDPQGDLRGILGDLEFAKNRASEGGHEVRTGTLDFMASEVMLQRYGYRPLFRPQYHQAEEDAGRHPPQFCSNALHDLESIWWLLLWVVFFNRDAATIEGNDKFVANREAKRRQLFSRSLDITHREPFFEQCSQRATLREWLPPSFYPLVDLLSNFTFALIDAYHTSEKNYTHIDEKALQIHDEVLGYLDDPGLLAKLKGIVLESVKTRPNARKRSHDNVEKGDDDVEPKSKRRSQASEQSRLQHNARRRA